MVDILDKAMLKMGLPDFKTLEEGHGCSEGGH